MHIYIYIYIYIYINIHIDGHVLQAALSGLRDATAGLGVPVFYLWLSPCAPPSPTTEPGEAIGWLTNASRGGAISREDGRLGAAPIAWMVSCVYTYR